MSSKPKMSKSEAGKLGSEIARPIIEESLNQRIAEYEKSPSICKECDKPIPYNKRHNKFCSRSCSNRHNNRGKCRNGNPRNKCEYCGKSLINTTGKKFCNHQCHSDYMWSNIKSKIESGDYMKTSNENSIRKMIKRYLIETNGYQCEICKNSIWMNKPIPLVCDHIDGNPYNNRLSNFRLVCGNCDMQLPTYKSKNIGNGRKYRRNNLDGVVA